MKYSKLLIIFLSILILHSCGYKNSNYESVNNFKINKLEIKGEEKLVYELKNNLKIYLDQNSPLIYNIKVNLLSTRESKIKNTSGKTIRYLKKLQAKLAVINMNSQKEFNKTFYSTNDYNIGTIHSDTLKNEKKADENNINYISDEIIKYLKLLNI